MAPSREVMEGGGGVEWEEVAETPPDRRAEGARPVGSHHGSYQCVWYGFGPQMGRHMCHAGWLSQSTSPSGGWWQVVRCGEISTRRKVVGGWPLGNRRWAAAGRVPWSWPGLVARMRHGGVAADADAAVIGSVSAANLEY